MKILKAILHFFGLHNWKIIRVYHYVDTSWGGHAQSTSVTKICTTCCKLQSQDHYGCGYITLEELTNPGVISK